MNRALAHKQSRALSHRGLLQTLVYFRRQKSKRIPTFSASQSKQNFSSLSISTFWRRGGGYGRPTSQSSAYPLGMLLPCARLMLHHGAKSSLKKCNYTDLLRIQGNSLTGGSGAWSSRLFNLIVKNVTALRRMVTFDALPFTCDVFRSVGTEFILGPNFAEISDILHYC